MSLEQSWGRVIAWVGTNAPATGSRLRVPAEPASLAFTEARFPVAWPEDLRAWYRLHDGAEMPQLWRCVLPGWTPLSLAEIIDWADMYAGQDEDLDADADADAEEPGAAGDIAWTFRPEFIPIGDNGCACTLFVDARPGPQSGCIRDFDRDEGALGEPKWASVSAMIDDLAEALEQSRPCDGWTAMIDDGELEWTV